ncbi:hypothetical protein A2851_03295 [Candidatus Kaiserbacteria bacterium RIFCSPHIGHO2_01_FULL_53_29]|uniref:Fido domain-containing protein n=1 Tax=Candidatus Kaiserbacteria bacterium RIFCSPHIGHO2_01_FULL_53_29 TaxID=1798480 RepID=A0A1F6CXK3_9BACT|nr:MAG: hypothetical protein A2851_03295 [Candidatus Kaiserbacteria bacterium RIFCSPHIGHO2_01_FULL_53_29]
MLEKKQLLPSERIGSILANTHIGEKLADPEKLRAWVKSATFESFLDILIGLNHAVQSKSVRPIDKEELKKGAGGVGHFILDPIFVAPNIEDRLELLHKTYDSMQRLILSKREDDAGLLLYMTLQSIHPFEDGNGRTGRALHLLLMGPPPISDTSSKEFIEDVLGVYVDPKDGGTLDGRHAFRHVVRSMTEIDPILNRLVADDVMGPEFASAYSSIQRTGAPFTYRAASSEEILKEFQVILSERGGQGYPLANIACTHVLQSKGLLGKYQANSVDYRSSGNPHEPKPPYTFNIDQVVRDFTDEEMKQVLDSYRDLKKAVVEKIIDVIEREQQYPDPQTRGKTTIKDSFYTYS